MISGETWKCCEFTYYFVVQFSHKRKYFRFVQFSYNLFIPKLYFYPPGEVTDTKVMLESCLLQWTDFNDSYEQIQRRLREMEKRLRGSDPKVDLSEKKAELQRIKVQWQ